MIRSRRILELIRSGMRSGALETATRLAVETEVSPRTILRDLDHLRDDLGAPVEYDASRKGFYLSEVGWTLPELTLSSRELTALHAIKKYAGTFNGTPFEKEMQSLLGKMEEGLGAQGAPGSKLMQNHCSIWEDDYTIPNPECWAVLSRCIEKRIKVRVRYQRFDGVTKEYTLHPYHLAWHHGQWYLLAFHERREDFAPFAVSRILRCHEKGGAFDRTDRFNPESFHEGSFGVSGGKAFTVRLRFTPKVAAFIAERVWHPSQTVKQLPSGGVELALKTSAWKPLVRFVLSWLPDVEVISPATLRERVHEKLVEGQGVPNHGCKG